MRRLLLSFCFIFAAGAAFAASAEIVDIDNAQLAKLVASGVPVIDVRTAPEWQETGVVPGSHLLTYFDERGKADPVAWLKQAKSIAKPGDPLIVICRSGKRSRAVSELLAQQAGYAKVYNAKSGIDGWAKEGRPMTSAAATLAACRAARTC